MDLFLSVHLVHPDFNFCIGLCVEYIGNGQKSSAICFSSGTFGLGVFSIWMSGSLERLTFGGRNFAEYVFGRGRTPPDLKGYLLHRLTYTGLGVAGVLFWVANMKRLRDHEEHQGLQWGSGGVGVYAA